MDDGPRIGGAQFLFLLMGAAPAYHVGLRLSTAGSLGDALAHTWFALLLVGVCWGAVGWLEVYARRRQREDEARRRSTAPAADPFVRDWEARL